MMSLLSNAYAQIAVFAAAVATIWGLLKAIGAFKAWVLKALEARRKRLAAPQKTLELVEALAVKVEKLQVDVQAIKQENAGQSQALKELDADTADILCSQLVREHDFFMGMGFCPSSDKTRIGLIYNRYKGRKRNHIADTFMDDILGLPEALKK